MPIKKLEPIGLLMYYDTPVGETVTHDNGIQLQILESKGEECSYTCFFRGIDCKNIACTRLTREHNDSVFFKQVNL